MVVKPLHKFILRHASSIFVSKCLSNVSVENKEAAIFLHNDEELRVSL